MRAFLICLIFFLGVYSLWADGSDFREDLDVFEGWREVPFLGIRNKTDYKIENIEQNSALVVQSENGISGIAYEKTIQVYETPYLEWRWRADILPEGADPRAKKTDDFALRFYVMFYSGKKLSVGDRIRYGFVKMLYGEYPPEVILGYVWTKDAFEEDYIQSRINERTRYIEATSGEKNRGTWQVHRVNIISDFRRVFGENPPETARIAIIGDSDSTGSASLGYVDYFAWKADLN